MMVMMKLWQEFLAESHDTFNQEALVHI